MKKGWIGLVICVWIGAACTPASPSAPTASLPAANQPAARPTATTEPTWTPVPSDTPTPVPPPTATPTLTKGAIRQQFLDEISKTIQAVPGVAEINLIMPLSDGVSIHLNTRSALSYEQPQVSWAVIQALAQSYGSRNKDDLTALLGSSDFTIYLTTTSSEGIYRYGSTTSWSTLVGVAKHQLNYDNWAEQASASFKP